MPTTGIPAIEESHLGCLDLGRRVRPVAVTTARPVDANAEIMASAHFLRFGILYFATEILAAIADARY
ncbi:hypothetical protein [Amycolatopsis thailandensis]|uniref:hypothetical protein n=1 Tax=Amycolatopsis thailandensis TaxID=589330 RepID=UPI00362E446E